MAVAGPKIQNFSVPAGDGVDLNWDVDPDAGVSLIGADIIWRAYEQEFGLPVAGSDPVISKRLDDGIQIDDPTALTFTVTIDRADTVGLLRNYYHEATVISEEGIWVTVTVGAMTVTQTENRDD